MISFNGATRLIQGHEFFYSGYLRAQRHFQSLQTFSSPTRDLTRIQVAAESVFPLVLTSAITAAGAASGLTAAQGLTTGNLVTGGRQLVPSRNMAQQRTNNLRPTATIAIFLRDFLPPLIR